MTTRVPRECEAHELWNCRPCRWQSGLPLDPPTPAAPLVPSYPEHEKLMAVAEKSQACGDFFGWLMERYTLGKYHTHDDSCRDEDGDPVRCDMGTRTLYPQNVSITRLLSEFFEIDEDKLEKEKLAMLEELRAGRSP